MEFGPTWRGNGNLADGYEDMMMKLGIRLNFEDIAWVMKDFDWLLVGSFGPHTLDESTPLVGLSYGYFMYLDGFYIILYYVTWRMSHSLLDFKGFNNFYDYLL